MKERFISLAIQQAKQSNCNNRLGAVICHQKTVLGAGYNKSSSPLLNKGIIKKNHANMGLHAEVAAMVGLDRKVIKGTTLYVVRLRRNNSIGMSKPCISCMFYITGMGVKKIIYSTDDGSFYIMKV